MYDLCPKIGLDQAKLLFPKVRDAGFSGVHYVDVIGIVPPRSCTHPAHPVTKREAIAYAIEMAEESRRVFGGFSTEGVYDFLSPYMDYGLYVSFSEASGPLGDISVPFWQLVYHGIVLSTPFRSTINTVVQDDARYTLKLVEFGGRPTLYVHSHFISGGRTNMGARDLRVTTDAELAETVRGIKTASDEFARRADLEFAMMERHEQVVPGVFKTTYAGGAYTLVNYNEAAVEIGVHKVPAMDYIVVRP